MLKFIYYQISRMEINIRFFGQLVDITGNTLMKIDDVDDTDTLLKQLHALYPALATMKYAVAVNKHIIQSNTGLQNNFEVAILPPFSGG